MEEIPYNIRNHRREQCKLCRTPCEFQNSEDYRAVGSNACPKGKWKAYGAKPKGAGDVVAMFAEPIAGAIDQVFKTKLKGCAACARRKELLNKMIPF